MKLVILFLSLSVLFVSIDCAPPPPTCDPNPCQNGAACGIKNGRVICICPSSFSGPRCDRGRAVATCSTATCLNGGSCSAPNGYCICPTGYTGTRCEIDIDDCAIKPCQNGGTCTDLVAAYACTCANDYTGDNCETKIDDCASRMPCQNGGTCEVIPLDYGGYEYQCICPDGYTGHDCEISPSSPYSTKFIYPVTEVITPTCDIWERYRDSSLAGGYETQHVGAGSVEECQNRCTQFNDGSFQCGAVLWYYSVYEYYGSEHCRTSSTDCCLLIEAAHAGNDIVTSTEPGFYIPDLYIVQRCVTEPPLCDSWVRYHDATLAGDYTTSTASASSPEDCQNVCTATVTDSFNCSAVIWYYSVYNSQGMQYCVDSSECCLLIPMEAVGNDIAGSTDRDLYVVHRCWEGTSLLEPTEFIYPVTAAP